MVLALLAYAVLFRHAAPWQATGRVVVVVQPLKSLTPSRLVGLGIDDMTLVRESEDPIQVSVRARRVRFGEGSDSLSLVLDTEVPVGAYRGFTFRLTSPESQAVNDREDAPVITLPYEDVALPALFSVDKDETTALIVGFETEQGIHEQTVQMLSYLPIFHIETRTHTSVGTTDTGEVEVRDGHIVTSAMYGMDRTGALRQNYREPQRETERSELAPVANDAALRNTASMPPTSTPRDTRTDELPDTTTSVSPQ